MSRIGPCWSSRPTRTTGRYPAGLLRLISPYAAAKREVNEELGLLVDPGRLLAVDWVPPKPARTDGVIFVYDGGQLSYSQTASISLPRDELRSWAWCTEHEAPNRLSELLTRRLVGARLARARGITLYLEDGRPR